MEEVQFIPGTSGHSAEYRVRLQTPTICLISVDFRGQPFSLGPKFEVVGRIQRRIDRISRRHALFQGQFEDFSAEKPAFHPVIPQVEAVDRPRDRVGQMPAGLGQSPGSEGHISRVTTIDFVQ